MNPSGPVDPMQVPASQPLMILVVDDDPDMRFYIRSCLQAGVPAAGRVIEAADGVEALTLVRAGAVDVVITDIVLPRLDGHGLCDVIKRDPQLSHIPVLLISGQPARNGHGDGFLPKPFNARQLREAFEHAAPGGERPRPWVAD